MAEALQQHELEVQNADIQTKGMQGQRRYGKDYSSLRGSPQDNLKLTEPSLDLYALVLGREGGFNRNLPIMGTDFGGQRTNFLVDLGK